MAYQTYMPGYGVNPMQPYPPRQEPYPPVIQQQAPQTAFQPPVQNAQASQGLSSFSRPVTSREEAMGVAADFSGALMVFPDISHGRVFLKRWNFQSGAAEFTEFAPVMQTIPEQEQTPAVAFASLQDLQDLQDVVDGLKSEIERMKKPTGKAGKKSEPSDE